MKNCVHFLLVIFISFFFNSSFAQNTGVQKTNEPINQVDGQGKRHGMWLNSVKCPDEEGACSEFGRYDHGRKMGVWYKVNREGELIAAENYRNGALDGESKYYDEGKLICIGHYRGMNPDNLYDTIIVTDPVTGAEELRQVNTDRGSQKHGTWKYFDDETGRLIKEEEYQVDVLIYRKDYPMSAADSARYAERNAKLPHNQKRNYTPPPSKMFSYINFK
jgi:hypothetical protein